jgi:predicted RNase H-like HicB family nuclease
MKFRVILEFDPETASYSAGNTEQEARQGIEEAIRLYLSPSDIEIAPDAKLLDVTVG